MRCVNCNNSQRNIIQDPYTEQWECIRKPQCLMEDITRRNKYSTFNFVVGGKILFKGEKRYWTIQGYNNRYIIATRKIGRYEKYTICDLTLCIRGADNYSSSGARYDYKNPQEIEIALLELSAENLQISKRNWIPLDIEKVK